MKFKLFLVFCLCLIISSCATFSGSHPHQMAKVKQSIDENHPRMIEASFLESFDATSINESLDYLETGRFEQLLKNDRLSLHKYAKATDYVVKSEFEAKIRVRNILKDAQATLTSDRERYYYIPDYEVTFLYAYQALNYLMKHDLENAAVSIRNLSYAQYATFESKKLSNNNLDDYNQVNSNKVYSNLSRSKQYRQLYSIANKVTNSYENGFGYYLAAIIYQSYDTNLNNANLSMKNALGVIPGNPYVQKDYAQIHQAFNQGGSIYKQGQGKLVVIYENGWVEPIQKFDLPIIIFVQYAGIQKISLPYYAPYSLGRSANVVVYNKDKKVAQGQTALLVDTTAMAAKSLSNRYPMIVTREILRLIAKTTMSITAIKSSGDYGALAMIGISIYNLATPQADQRSWNLLPRSVDLFSTGLDQGQYTVRVDNKIEKVSVEPQRVTLVWIVKEQSFEKILFKGEL
ncbi:COG3014 family protein [Francisella halioticida]|uniref:COG3014 family protein n=1 Tax=Francisella halioticida TaxID=549298 RepID=UPI001BB3E98D